MGRELTREQINGMVSAMRTKGMLHRVARYNMDISTDDGLRVIEALGRDIIPTFRLDVDNRWTYTQLVRWLLGDPTMEAQNPTQPRVKVRGVLTKGIYLAGKTGTGKSTALTLLLALAEALKVQISIDNDVRPMAWQEMRTDDVVDEYMRSGTFYKLVSNLGRSVDFKTEQILCLQDLGTEQSECNFKGNRVSPLRSVLEARGDNLATVTLISSNIPLGHEALSDRYGDRVQSRLCGMCNYLTLGGGDRRRPSATEV